MLFGLIDRASMASPLKSSLDQSVQRSRAIADRVAQASVNNGDGFRMNAKAGDAAAGGHEPPARKDLRQPPLRHQG